MATNQERAKIPLAERYWARVQRGDENDCWPWLGAVNHVVGYGYYGWRHGHNESAHRLAWRLTFGEIPKHLQIDHICGNPLCCNPNHMQLLSPAQHSRKSTETRYGHLGSGEICRHGHVGERYRRPSDGSWRCRACDREYMRRKRGTHRSATTQAA